MTEVGIAASSLAGFADHDEVASRGGDVVFDVARDALDRAGLTREDVDAVIGCDQDGLTGVTVSFGMKACAAASYNKPSTRVQNGGVFAIHLARTKIRAGKADCVMIASEDSVQFDESAVANVSHDPLYDRPVGQSQLVSYGLLSDYHLSATDTTERDYAEVAAKNYRAGADNPWAHHQGPDSAEEILRADRVVGPLREPETPGPSAGGGAVVLVSEDLAADLDVDPIWIDGAGLGSSRYTIHELDDWLAQPSLEKAVETAYAEAGVDDPRATLDLAEVYDPVPTFELLGYETLGLCSEGEAAGLVHDGVTAPDGEFPVNPSGGALVTNPLNTGGLYRTIQAERVLRGEHPSTSVSGAERAVVTGGDIMLGVGGRTDGALVLNGGAS